VDFVVEEEPEQVPDNDQTLRQLCLESEPYVMIESINVIEQIEVETDLDEESNNGNSNNSHVESEDSAVVNSVTNNSLVNEGYIKLGPKAIYVCNWDKYKSVMGQHINKDNNTSGYSPKRPFICDYVNCHKSYSVKYRLFKHIEEKHKSKRLRRVLRSQNKSQKIV